MIILNFNKISTIGIAPSLEILLPIMMQILKELRIDICLVFLEVLFIVKIIRLIRIIKLLTKSLKREWLHRD